MNYSGKHQPIIILKYYRVKRSTSLLLYLTNAPRHKSCLGLLHIVYLNRLNTAVFVVSMTIKTLWGYQIFFSEFLILLFSFVEIRDSRNFLLPFQVAKVHLSLLRPASYIFVMFFLNFSNIIYFVNVLFFYNSELMWSSNFARSILPFFQYCLSNGFNAKI